MSAPSRPTNRDPAALQTESPLRARELWGAGLLFGVLAWLPLPFIGDFHGIIDHRHNLVVPAAARHTLLHFGQLPLWNPYAKGGFNGFAAMEDGSLFPTFPLTLLFDVFVAVQLEYLLFTALLGVGLMLLSQRFGASRAGSLIAGLCGVFSSTLAVYLVGGWGMHFTMALLPLVWWTWLKDTPRHRILCGVLLALFFFRGGMYPLAYAVMTLGVFAIVDAIRERRPAPLVQLVVVGGLALALSAIKLVPTLLDGDLGVARGTEGYCFNLGGLAVGLVTWQLNGSHFEGVGAIGPVAAILAIAGLLTRREMTRRVAPVLVLLAIYALGSNLSPSRWFGDSNQMHLCAPGPSLHDLIEHIPGLASLWNPSRALVPLGLLLAAFAGVGFDGLTRTLRGNARALTTLAVALAIVLPAFYATRTALHRDMSPLLWPADVPDDTTFRQLATCPGNDAFCPELRAGSARSATFPFHPTPEALRVTGDAEYLGEHYWLAAGEATQVAWSPNVLVYRTPGPGRLVINQRFHRGWQSDQGAVEAHHGLLSIQTDGGEVTLRYRPRSLWYGLPISLFGLLAAGVFWRRSGGTRPAELTR